MLELGYEDSSYGLEVMEVAIWTSLNVVAWKRLSELWMLDL